MGELRRDGGGETKEILHKAIGADLLVQCMMGVQDTDWLLERSGLASVQ